MSNELNPSPLVHEVKHLIEQSKKQIAVSINSALTLLYWEIGQRITKETLSAGRAEYGKQIVSSLLRQLASEYGSSFSEKKFAEVFSDKEIVAPLMRQLSWTHIRELIPIKDPLKRDFYIEICKLEKWSVWTLRERIQSMLSERTAISKKPEETIKNDLELLRNEQQLSPGGYYGPI